jgi:hypothetical protein
MSSTRNHEINALRVAEWKAEAAVTGQTFAQVATASMKLRMGAQRVVVSRNEAWADIDANVRGFLVAIATDRPTRSDRIRWDNLTPDEQTSVGVLARLLVRELEPVAAVLR